MRQERPSAASLLLLLLRSLQGLLGARLVLLLLLARSLATSRRRRGLSTACCSSTSGARWRTWHNGGWRRLAAELRHLLGRQRPPSRQLGEDLVGHIDACGCSHNHRGAIDQLLAFHALRGCVCELASQLGRRASDLLAFHEDLLPIALDVLDLLPLHKNLLPISLNVLDLLALSGDLLSVLLDVHHLADWLRHWECTRGPYVGDGLRRSGVDDSLRRCLHDILHLLRLSCLDHCSGGHRLPGAGELWRNAPTES